MSSHGSSGIRPRKILTTYVTRVQIQAVIRGLGSDGDEDARVLQDLDRRSKTWHDEEAARAREVKIDRWIDR